MRTIPFNIPHVAPGTLERMAESLARGHTAGDGPFTREASAALSRWLDGAEVLLTTSGTHALELGALLLGVGPDDEVVLPSFTFSSTANAVALRGARCRFADVDPTTFTMGLPQLEAAVTPQTTVVVAMSYAGVTGDLDQVAAWCAARGLRLMEDNAHGLFGRLHGKALGTFAPLGALSFHQTKNVSCGEGGALILADPTYRLKAEILREKGTDRSRFLRGEVDRYTWRAVGSSFLPSDLLAAALCAQLAEADAIQARRHAIWSTYRELLEPVASTLDLTLQRVPEGNAHPAHAFALLAPPGLGRDHLLQRMLAEGVRATSHYEPLHLAPAHAGAESLPVTVDVAARLLRLPLYADLQVDDAAQVARTLIRLLETRR